MGKLTNNFSDMSEEDRILLAQTINEADLTWTADPYLSTPSEEMNFAQTGAESYSHAHAHNHRHQKAEKKQFGEQTPEF